MRLMKKLKEKVKESLPVSRAWVGNQVEKCTAEHKQDVQLQAVKLVKKMKKIFREDVQKSQEEFEKKQIDLCQKLYQNIICEYDERVVQLSRRMDSQYSMQEKNARKQTNEMLELRNYFDREIARRADWEKRPSENLRLASGRPVWAIKCPAPEGERKVQWGDYSYALALKKYLERLNIYVILDFKEDWDCDEGADVVVVLRGCYFYRPDRRNAKCKYIMWNISHPDMITIEEYQLYDAVCVSSRYYAKQLQKTLTIPVYPLLQCTDTELFYPSEKAPEEFEHEYLFIGNSRGIARPCVIWSVENKLPLHIIGGGWDSILRDHMENVTAPFIANEEIPDVYRKTKVTLNDHWKDMLEKRFINNRIFDALACGLPVISDCCDELQEIFPDAVLYYHNKEEFEECIKKIEEDYKSIKNRVKEQWPFIKERFSFEARAKELVEIVNEIS